VKLLLNKRVVEERKGKQMMWKSLRAYHLCSVGVKDFEFIYVMLYFCDA